MAVTGGEDRQTVGVGRPSEVGGSAPDEEFKSMARGLERPRGVIGRPVARMLKGSDERQRNQSRPSEIRVARHLFERVAHEEYKPDDRRHRISGKSENQGPRSIAAVGADAEPDRLARLDSHFVKDAFHTQAREHLGNKVEFSRRHASTDEKHVRLQSSREALGQ